MLARTRHCGLNACLFRKKLTDSPAREYGRADEIVLHVPLRCDRYAEARKGKTGAGAHFEAIKAVVKTSDVSRAV